MFAAFGTVTDCSLKFTKDGKFRKFGFVGFKSEEDANSALNHFNKSFVDTSRVTVGAPFTAFCSCCRHHCCLSVCEPTVNNSSRWRCVKPLETPPRPEPGANTARVLEQRNPPLLQTPTARRSVHTSSNTGTRAKTCFHYLCSVYRLLSQEINHNTIDKQ